jgi:hypothetical protein
MFRKMSNDFNIVCAPLRYYINSVPINHNKGSEYYTVVLPEKFWFYITSSIPLWFIKQKFDNFLQGEAMTVVYKIYMN